MTTPAAGSRSLADGLGLEYMLAVEAELFLADSLSLREASMSQDALIYKVERMDEWATGHATTGWMRCHLWEERLGNGRGGGRQSKSGSN